MPYFYKDFSFKRHTIRYVRPPNVPTPTTAHRRGSAFTGTGTLPAASASLTSHDRYHLRQLRAQQATEKQLVFFDIFDAQLDNPGPELMDFEEWVNAEDTTTWELTSSPLA